MINIEVAYAVPDRQVIVPLNVDDDTTVEAAIQASGILDIFPELQQQVLCVGIWSRKAKLTDSLRDGDRIEIYRELTIDPKEARLKRAKG